MRVRGFEINPMTMAHVAMVWGAEILADQRPGRALVPPDGDEATSVITSQADLEKAVSDIREFIQATQRTLDFSIDDSTHQVVVKVIATESGEVIRQLPSETALKLAQSLHDASSLLFDAKA